MNIVHVITRMILGGAQENTLLTCEGLQQRGHDVTLITGPTYGPEGELLARAQNGNYRLIQIDTLRRPIHPLRDLKAYRALKHCLRDLNPDVVHTHSAKAGILGRFAASSLRREQARACCSTVEKVRTAQLNLCGKPRIVHTIHGLAFHRYQPAWRNKIYIRIEKDAARHCDGLISVADAMTSQALAAGIGAPQQYTTIYSGMETRDYTQPPSPERQNQLRLQLDIPADALVIATVARLAELKGHDYIIDAARQLAPRYPQVIWLFIGDGYWRLRLERRLAQERLTDRFRLTGLVSPRSVGEYLHCSDLLVHCSLREGLARALPQALLAGKAVISFDLDGAPEVVLDGQTGLLVPPADVPALVHAQQRLIDDPELRIRLGREGRKRCEKMFDHEQMVDKILSFYRFVGAA